MKKLVVVLAGAVVAAGAVATDLWLDLRVERGKAGEIAARLTAAESIQPAQAGAPLPPVSVTPPVAGVSPRPATSTPISAAPANQQSAARATDSPMMGILEMMAKPESQDATRRRLTQRYPDIEQELGISAQEKQRLFDLLVEQEQVMQEQDQDIAGMMRALQDPAAAREMQRMMGETARDQKSKMSALLGSRYPKWEEYQGTVSARSEVDQLRRTLSASGNPLSEDQAKQLVTAFAPEKRRVRTEDREWNNSSAALNSPNLVQESMQRDADSRNRLVDVASLILNPAQLDRYKRQVEQESNMMRAAMEMMTGAGKP